MPGATAVQPDISLGVTSPQVQQQNPINMLQSLAATQNALNQNRLFQQEFGAKQRAGQIISSAPDLETGMTQLYSDPQTAAFAGPIINGIRESQRTMLQMSGEKQSQAQGALAQTLKSLGGAINDPSQLEPLISANLATVSSSVAPEVRSAISSVVRALGEGNPTPTQYQARLGGLMLGTGFTPDSLRAITGAVPAGVTFQPVGPGGSLQPLAIGGPAAGGGGAIAPVGVAGGGGNPLTIRTAPTTAPGAGSLTAPSPTGPSAGTPPGGIAGPTLDQQQYLSDRGKQMAQYQTELDDSVKTGNSLMQTIQEAKEARDSFKPGGGAAGYARAAQIAQAFGAPNDLVDKIANGNLAASQEFGKIANNFVMGQLRQSLQGIGGSRINQQEFEAFTKNNPNLDTDPRAIDKIFQFWSRQHNYNIAEQSALAEAQSRPGFNMLTWPAQWQKIAQAKGMVNVGTTEAGGQRPVPSAGGATHEWIPGQGLRPIPGPASP
jgi:hypothetical protein